MSTQRRATPGEWLEEGNLQPADVQANLRDLEFINRRLGGARAVVPHSVRFMVANASADPFRVLDIACGGGDVLREIAGQARRLVRPMVGIGVDVNGQVIGYARSWSADWPELEWMRADALELPFMPASFDLVVCSCFLHHLDFRTAAAVVETAARVSRGAVVVSDLVRSRAGALAFKALCQVAGLHPVTRHDGLLSLERAYSVADLEDIARGARAKRWRLYRTRFCRATIVLEVG